MAPRPSPSAIRDALGLARILYAVEASAVRADPTRLDAILSAGKSLATAARFAKLEPGSLGHRAAPAHALAGLDALAAVGWSPEIAALITAARRRALGG